jgi:hypothetical protein
MQELFYWMGQRSWRIRHEDFGRIDIHCAFISSAEVARRSSATGLPLRARLEIVRAPNAADVTPFHDASNQGANMWRYRL